MIPKWLHNGVLNFFFPPTCLHCQQAAKNLFCDHCASLLEMIDPTQRCPFCFLENAENKVCKKCLLDKNFLCTTGAVFDYFGPVTTLVKCLKYQNMSFLADLCAPFLFLQLERLGWEIDCVVPVPRGILRTFFYGYNQSALLAEGLAKQLAIPLEPVLSRAFFAPPHTNLPGKKRRHMAEEGFRIKKNVSFRDKTVLLVDDVMTTQSTLLACANLLLEGEPKKIYALTLARR